MKIVDKAFYDIKKAVSRKEVVPFGEYDKWSDSVRLEDYLTEIGYAVIQDKKKALSMDELIGLVHF